MNSPAIMTDADLGPLSEDAPGTRIQYGTDPLQFGELSLPAERGSAANNGSVASAALPVVVNVHGGCWLAEYSIDHSRAQARALADAGFAVWNIEYRRVGNGGGGWPGTFQDVARALDHVRVLATSYPLDLARICLMGHSAGGQLALWLAARSRIDPRSELYVRDALPVRGVVALAPATELRELHARRVFDDVVDRLVGGSPAAFPERYAAVSPGDLVPTQVPQVVIIGKHDDFWGWNALAYVAAARNAGEPHVAFEIIESAGHFEVIDPRTDAWRSVLAAARRLV